MFDSRYKLEQQFEAWFGDFRRCIAKLLETTSSWKTIFNATDNKAIIWSDDINFVSNFDEIKVFQEIYSALIKTCVFN